MHVCCATNNRLSHALHTPGGPLISLDLSALPAACAYHVVCLSRALSIVLPFFLSLSGPEAIPVLMFGVNISSVMVDHPAEKKSKKKNPEHTNSEHPAFIITP